jgi:hypothetical protein
MDESRSQFTPGKQPRRYSNRVLLDYKTRTDVFLITFVYMLTLYARFAYPLYEQDRLCGLVVRVLGYRSGGPGSIPGTTRKKNLVGLERGAPSLVSTN